MKWIKVIGFGIFLWILMFAIVSAFISFGIYKFIWIQGAIALIAGIISFVLAGKVKPDKATLAISYGLTWVVIGLILDATVTMKFNPEIFTSWSLWAGYILVLLAPVLRVKKSV